MARKLDKANRDNVLLMQIIQKSGEATSIPPTTNNVVNEINRTSSMNSSTNKQASNVTVPQNKGIMPRLNKTTNPTKKKQTSMGGNQKMNAPPPIPIPSATQQKDNHHGPLHENKNNAKVKSDIKGISQDQDKSPMMHPARSSSKPLIPLLNLDKVPLPIEEDANKAVEETKLEDLIQVDTGKLASPTPGRENEVDYDMSSFVDSDSDRHHQASLRQQQVANMMDGDRDLDDEAILAGVPTAVPIA